MEAMFLPHSTGHPLLILGVFLKPCGFGGPALTSEVSCTALVKGLSVHSPRLPPSLEVDGLVIKGSGLKRL